MPQGPDSCPEETAVEIIAILTLVLSAIYTFSFIYLEMTRRC